MRRIPALLATAAVHHHLVRQGRRAHCGLIVESGEPREVHHFALVDRLRGGRDQPVRGVGDAGGIGGRRPARGRGQRQDRHQKLHQGHRQRPAEGHVQDGDIHASELSRRAEFRSGRPEPAGHPPVFHIDPFPRSEGIGVAEIAAEARKRHARAFPAAQSPAISSSIPAASTNGGATARRTCSIR